MTMTETIAAREITYTRVYDAPRALVWRAWTEPERLAQWWGPRGWSTDPEDVTIDLALGGLFRVRSTKDDGSEMTNEAHYREIVPPERLVIEESAEDAWHDGAWTVVTFTDLGDGRTEMTMRATVHTTDEMRGAAESGLTSAFDRLAEHLEAR
jgi:uncharacterized protein YndB with AHSA1/START domain